VIGVAGVVVSTCVPLT
jgi:hypothetical protein